MNTAPTGSAIDRAIAQLLPHYPKGQTPPEAWRRAIVAEVLLEQVSRTVWCHFAANIIGEPRDVEETFRAIDGQLFALRHALACTTSLIKHPDGSGSPLFHPEWLSRALESWETEWQPIYAKLQESLREHA